ncbi:MAG: thioredoxin-disulfide reductase [Candidatus Wildermuthbacteria bacterium GWA2_46_15]|uniref:Thioredoxin reductase n=1 Tax=Candidatus Wildermuthbacteria bacterium GWA2_46_15 TaxID=1802443 RepID=A0A1G2QQ73_9BACT|nr:MAG: thioredoxin-disulfide reductase [Candidatus Wildermuthbacteria bacterium GWA2_46_15]
MKKIIIIGSGPAGLTAALYAARARFEPLVLAGAEPGGQLTWTALVENFPGFPEGVDGPDLTRKMRAQAEKFGATVMNESVKSVDFSQRPFKIILENGQTEEAEAVIIATGAAANWLGLPNEQRLIGHGVSSCATCDGFFFKEKKVAVVGGGDAAMEEARYLAKICSEVHLIERGAENKMRASKIMIDYVKAFKNVVWHFKTEVADVLGGNKVEGLKLKNNQTGQEEEIILDGLFVAIGHSPATGFLTGQLEINERGYIKTEAGSTKTKVAGVFACGDCVDWLYRQAVTAAGDGCRAALDAERYLQSLLNII